MYKWLCLVASFVLFEAIRAQSDSAEFERAVRSFPYNIQPHRMLGYISNREPLAYYGAEDEMAQIIDTLNKGEAAGPRLRRSGGQQVKSFGTGYSWNTPPLYRQIEITPVYGYACRFKFCRIFDA